MKTKQAKKERNKGSNKEGRKEKARGTGRVVYRKTLTKTEKTRVGKKEGRKYVQGTERVV